MDYLVVIIAKLGQRHIDDRAGINADMNFEALIGQTERKVLRIISDCFNSFLQCIPLLIHPRLHSNSQFRSPTWCGSAKVAYSLKIVTARVRVGTLGPDHPNRSRGVAWRGREHSRCEIELKHNRVPPRHCPAPLGCGFIALRVLPITIFARLTPMQCLGIHPSFSSLSACANEERRSLIRRSPSALCHAILLQPPLHYSSKCYADGHFSPP